MRRAFDRYQILDLLRAGDSWKLYRAYDPRFQRMIALLAVQVRDEGQRQQLLNEAQNSVRMRHAGVIKTHDFGQAEGTFFMALEFLPGADLMQLLGNLKQTDQWILLPEAIQLVRQVAQALQNIHQRGVQHYGLTPQSIRLRDEHGEGLPYQPVLADPGISVPIGRPAVDGAVAYLSPEEALEQKADRRSDVFALGVLLYELIFCQPPFAANTKELLAASHKQGPQAAPQTFRAELPKGFELFLKKALALDPAGRYESAEAFGQALAEAFPGLIGLDLGMETTSPLLDAFRRSLKELPEPATPESPPVPEAGVKVPGEPLPIRLQILTADHSIRHFSLTPGSLTIGRDQDNQLCLQDPRASRHHARLEFDGSNLQVIDLNSKNGTYLGNTRLDPNAPVKWDAQAAVRIGGTWLRQENAGQAHSEPAGEVEATANLPTVARRAPAPETAQFEAARMAGKIMLLFEPVQLSVIPGSKAAALVTLLNNGTSEEEFQLSVHGVPADWVTGFPRMVRAAPGQQQELRLEFQPPRRPSSKAGRHSLTIRAAGRSTPDQGAAFDPRAREFSPMPAEVRGVLTLATFSEVQSQVSQGQVQSGEPLQVKVRNQGNAPETVTVSWSGKGISFDPPEVKLSLQPGQSATAEAVARASQSRWIGSEQALPFTTYVRTASEQVETHAGNLLSRGILPVWGPPAALLACLALAGGVALLALFLSWVSGGKMALSGQQTSTAIARNLTVQAAETATAGWISSDADRDGLSNEQELAAGTDPNAFDTDGDGLGDGEEVARSLNPLQADIDGDGWKDGLEIARGTDPKNKDTDADGIIDSEDPDPGKAPTATPTLTPTQTQTPVPRQPSPTVTPTRTSSATPSPTASPTRTITPTSTVTPTPTLTPPPANQPPVIVVNGASVVNEGDQVTFPSNWLAISDPDAGTEPIQVSLEAGEGNGALTILNHDGLTGGTWSGQSLTFQGPQAKIQDAMQIVTFKPEDKFPGASIVIINIVIRVNDMGHTGAGDAGVDQESYRVTVNGENDAPTMKPPDSISFAMKPDGVFIKDILPYLIIEDEDENAKQGIAITKLQPETGIWKFTTDGNTWTTITNTNTTPGYPTDNNALLLAADDNTRIGYTPGGENENDPVEITFRAWDQTGADKNGETSSTTPNGGKTPFSESTAKVTFEIPAVQNGSAQPLILSTFGNVLAAPGQSVLFALAAMCRLLRRKEDDVNKEPV